MRTAAAMATTRTRSIHPVREDRWVLGAARGGALTVIVTLRDATVAYSLGRCVPGVSATQEARGDDCDGRGQTTGGLPRRAMRAIVAQRRGTRSPAGVRQPSHQPANHGRRRPGVRRDRATCTRVQVATYGTPKIQGRLRRASQTRLRAL